MADVKMRITATDAASPTIQKVKGELAGLDRQAGTAAGASFQVGFLGVVQQGLPQGILAALAAQLLPMLAAGFAAQGSRTGAQ